MKMSVGSVTNFIIKMRKKLFQNSRSQVARTLVLMIIGLVVLFFILYVISKTGRGSFDLVDKIKDVLGLA